MLGHTIETGRQHRPSFSAFHLVHLPGHLLFDALAEFHMLIVVYDIAQEVDALARREHALVGLHLQPDFPHALMHHVTNHP